MELDEPPCGALAESDLVPQREGPAARRERKERADEAPVEPARGLAEALDADRHAASCDGGSMAGRSRTKLKPS